MSSETLTFIICAKSPFPNEVIFTGTETWGLDVSFSGENPVQLTTIFLEIESFFFLMMMDGKSEVFSQDNSVPELRFFKNVGHSRPTASLLTT